MKTIKVLGICGSLRRLSTNMNLLRYARENAPSGNLSEAYLGRANLRGAIFCSSEIYIQGSVWTGIRGK